MYATSSAFDGFLCTQSEIRSCHLKKEKAKPTADGEKPKGGSSHYKRNIRQFEGSVMATCIAEIKKVEVVTKRHGTVPCSHNKIAQDYGLSPSSVSELMTGKVSSDILYVSLVT